MLNSLSLKYFINIGSVIVYFIAYFDLQIVILQIHQYLENKMNNLLTGFNF